MYVLNAKGRDGFQTASGGGVRRSPPRRHINILSTLFSTIYVTEVSEFFQSSACQDDGTGCHTTYLAKGSNSQVLGQYELSHLDRGLFPFHVVMAVFSLSLFVALLLRFNLSCHIALSNKFLLDWKDERRWECETFFGCVSNADTSEGQT